MAFRVFWYVPHQTLCMELEGDLTLDDFNLISQAIIEHLGTELTEQHKTLVVDITRPARIPQAFAQLKASQTYVLRRDLRFIVVAGTNKFMRLMMMLTFNLCRPSLRFFDDMDRALAFAQGVTPVSH